MLGGAVIVAGDRSGTDISALSDSGIADIGEMVDLGAGFDRGVFDLDKITDAAAGGEAGTGAQTGIGPNRCLFSDCCALKV